MKLHIFVKSGLRGW